MAAINRRFRLDISPIVRRDRCRADIRFLPDRAKRDTVADGPLKQCLEPCALAAKAEGRAFAAARG